MSTLLLALAAAAAPAPTIRTQPCRRAAAEPVAARPSSPVRRLGDMPPARQVLGVYRSIDGCPTPVVVRDEVGANGRR